MQTNRDKQDIRVDGVRYSHDALMEMLARKDWDEDDAKAPLWEFLAAWFDPSPLLTVHTSGSTGKPKYLEVKKEQMMNSACITCRYLGLERDDSALLCMSLDYIAGKMMVVRALVAQFNLVYRIPSGHPMHDVEQPLRFAAMVPMQVYNSLHDEEERRRMDRIENLIIGGGAVDEALQQSLQMLSGKVYSTYGMTETLSHIALRRLNGRDASDVYHPFDSVGLSLSEEGTLTIDAPLVCDERLVTNDVAELRADGSFRILGRKDNIVNSGGIKIQIEEVEQRIKALFAVPFALTSVPDARLGEALVLLVEKKALPLDGVPEPSEVWKEQLEMCIADRYRCPKHLYRVKHLPMTGSGKIDRAACKRLAAECKAQEDTTDEKM